MSNPFLAILRQHTKGPDFRPATKSELARELGIASDDRAEFRRALRTLEASGELVCGKRSRYAPPSQSSGGAQKITGTIFFPANEKRRHGFFRPDPELKSLPALKAVTGDIFVPARFSATAMHGDRVAVKLTKREAPRWHRHVKSRRDRSGQDENTMEAGVVEILSRGQTRVVGTFRQHGRYAHLLPDHPSLPASFNLEGSLLGARNGDKVVGELLAWDSPNVPPQAQLIEVLGRPDAPGVDVLTVIHRYGLPLKFPDVVLAEADTLPDAVDDETELARREDWRDREVFTIDPEDARDFDDAIFVHAFHPDEGGGWELAVHIADVSHYVRSGSAIDREAKKRGNSVYLADRVLPMLPEKLSNGLCSLKPGVDRLTHAVIMRFDRKGQQTSVRYASAVIRSRRRYTYEEAFVRLNLSNGEIDHFDPEEASLGHHLKRAWDLGKLLRENRYRAGALDLDFPEVRAVLDDQGRAIDVKRSDYDESHQLIEEFMLAANEAVAREAKNAQAPSLYRIHEDPDPDQLFEFAFQVGGYGYQAGDVTIRAELQKVLRAIRGKPEEHALKIALLKSLKRAAYSAEPMGHYGLAKVNYTHFTSPIRRYADLVIHRVLRRLVASRSDGATRTDVDTTPGQGQLAEIAKHISETERVAADAEQETRRMKLIEYLVRVSGEENGRAFDGIVYDVRPIGAFIELTDLLIKGLIRKDDLPAGYYRFDAARNRIMDPGGKFQLAVGHRVKVRVARIDHSRGFIDFALVQE
ncbi:MAG: ribonuclease R [Verrucomicrobiae bacterium]|nr:ribonuclease R [Verrucomicrobiae bacterium]